VEQPEHRRAGERDLFRGSARAVGYRVEVSPLFRHFRKPLRPHARVAHRRQGRPYRVLYAFDPQRNAVLPIGGDKTGNEQWYETSVPLADRLYERRLIELEESDDHGKSKKL